MPLLLPNVVEFVVDMPKWSAVVYVMPRDKGGPDWQGAEDLALRSARTFGLRDPTIVKRIRDREKPIYRLAVEGEFVEP